MSRANDFTPPLDSTVEFIPVAFDFSVNDQIKPGETIVSVVLFTCSTYIGDDLDPTPSVRLIGSPSIIASEKTNAPLAAVAQGVGNGVGGVTYRFQCVVMTSFGNRPSLWNHWPCVTPD